MTDSDVAIRRYYFLKASLATLRSANDAPSFYEAIYYFYAFGGVAKSELAHEFEVSRPTVDRWLSGENAPHPAMIPHVLQYLERALSAITEKSPIFSRVYRGDIKPKADGRTKPLVLCHIPGFELILSKEGLTLNAKKIKTEGF